MLLRTYRLTDKIGVIILKSAAALVDLTLEGLLLVRRAFVRLIVVLLSVIWVILLPLRLLARVFVRGASRATVGAGSSLNQSMARRAARSQVDSQLREDPVRAQNRALNAVTLLLLAALVGVVLWATNPARSGGSNVPLVDGGLNAALFAGNTATAPTVIAAAGSPVGGGAGGLNFVAPSVPTATALPILLQVRGTLAYTRRENGHNDLWAVPVDGRASVRLTNDVGDERDPVWSPTAPRIAYAGNSAGNWDVYVLDLATNTNTRVTLDLSYQGSPSWSPDGQYLIYETYQGNSLNLAIIQADGREEAIALPANTDAAEFSPAWSPADGGRQIAFVSWRDGSADIFVFSLDDQSVVNVTNTPTRQENDPKWSPDGNYIAYSALDQGLEKVFVKAVASLNEPAQAIGIGRAPAWSPDGSSIVAAVQSLDGTQFVALPFQGAGVVTPVIQVASGATSPDWTASPLPAALVNARGLPATNTDPLVVEQEQRLAIDPPYRLRAINVNTEQPSMSERVDDSFNALREAVLNAAGWDVLGRLDDAFWDISRPPSPGETVRSWLKTGRAIGLTRADILGDPPSFEIVREDIGVDVYWRVYVRVVADAQSGQLGEPLRDMPWDFASRTQGDVEAYDQGGRLKREIPAGYYVDLTEIAADYGWTRLPAGNDWRANINSVNFWLLVKPDGLTWYQAMRELYTEGALLNFAPTGIPDSTVPAGATIIVVTAIPDAASEVELATLPPAADGVPPPDLPTSTPLPPSDPPPETGDQG